MPTPADIAATLTTAPAWALLALTMRSERLRDDGAAELARHLHARLYGAPTPDPAQLTLPLA